MVSQGKLLTRNMVYRTSNSIRRGSQQGYAIMMVLFFVALLCLTVMTVAPNILTQARRERETEMVWRGKQYVRGIKLYYRKTGKLPTSLDDLTKPSDGNIRFMRQAYKDPMNAKDGEWRLIYVGPTGQVIGSLNPAIRMFRPGVGSPTGVVPGTPASQVAAQSSSAFGQGLNPAASQIFGNVAGTSATGVAGAAGQQILPAGAAFTGDGPSGDSSASASNSSADDAANEALLESEPATVVGGRIIGIGSKINRSSILIYEKAKNYKLFEFIWDPNKDPIVLTGTAGQNGAGGQPIQPLPSLPSLVPGQTQTYTNGPNPPGYNPDNPNNQNGPNGSNGQSNPPQGPPETAPNPPQP